MPFPSVFLRASLDETRGPDTAATFFRRISFSEFSCVFETESSVLHCIFL